MNNINLTQLRQAFERFQEMYYIYEEDKEQGLIEEAVKESLAQRFEYCTEISWKTLRRHLEHSEGLVVKASPKEVIREAGKLEILDAEMWIGFIDARQLTAHDYDIRKLEELLSSVKAFAEHSEKLLRYLERYENDES